MTGTRADYGKLKSLIQITEENEGFDVRIFATGMHLDDKYGKTVIEIYKSGFTKVHEFQNYTENEHMDKTLANTVYGFSDYIRAEDPDLIVIHGDRLEALAGAIVGSMNNKLVAHIEGGEVSGTIDELIRHSVSKLSHIHLVSNSLAKKRLVQMGELESSIHIIGSPDLDLMNPKLLPDLDTVKDYYKIDFEEYAIAMFHPVTTEVDRLDQDIKTFVDVLLASGDNYVVIYPNNDIGTDLILKEYERFKDHPNIRMFPSLRFEYFLRLLKESKYIIGNSSVGIREAPHYNVPTIDLGTRQNNRSKTKTITNVEIDFDAIMNVLTDRKYNIQDSYKNKFEFGSGNSNQLFLKLLQGEELWAINCQKQFQDL